MWSYFEDSPMFDRRLADCVEKCERTLSYLRQLTLSESR